MSSTATSAAPVRPSTSPKQQFLDVYEMECGKTLRVLQAQPKDKSELRPHPKAKTARELAFTFVAEQGLSMKALTTGLDWSQPPQFPKAPESLDQVIAAFDDAHRKMAEIVRSIPEEKLLTETVTFPTGPGQMGEFQKMQFLWMLLSDQIHHRGQFSVYVRMADGKVPSIYGPSLDEPWM
jgi:uncharacterized damage-inducible protein DinB